MKTLELTGLKGEFEVFLYDSKKELKAYRKVKNLTVNTGFQKVCDMMGSGGIDPFKYCAIGSGTIEASALDTQLGNELARELGDYTRTSDKVWINESTFPTGVGTGTITESGLLNASSLGTLLCRATFGAITKTSTDVAVFSWQYTLS